MELSIQYYIKIILVSDVRIIWSKVFLNHILSNAEDISTGEHSYELGKNLRNCLIAFFWMVSVSAILDG